MTTKKKKPAVKKKQNSSSMGVDDFGAYLPNKATIKAQKNAIRGRKYTEKEFREYNLKRQAEEELENRYDLTTYAAKI